MEAITALFEELARLGVRLRAENDQLKVSAAKGVINDDLRRRMAEHRDELLRRLAGRGVAATAPAPLRADRDALGQPFPLSDLQLGFYVANDPHMEFHVRPHLYMEFNRSALDLAAYEAAWNRVLARHRDSLCVVDADMRMHVLRDLAPLRLRVHDWRQGDSADAAAGLAAVRAELERQELPLDRWPWFDLRVSLWLEDGAERARIHYNHNSFFIDGFGLTLLMTEVERCYREPVLVLEPPALAFRDAVLGLERLAQSAIGQAARAYWVERLPGLPGPPGLPQAPGAQRRCRAMLTRRECVLAAPQWGAFKQRAQAHGVTPSNAITAAYACLLASWSNSDHFIVSNMVTRRMADLHPDMLCMIGNFVSLYPLEIALQPEASFAANARSLQEQVMQDMRHLQCGGMQVLQELNRQQGAFGSAPSPFVVGSGLLLKGWQAADYTVLETSQTLIDHQFFELADGSLHLVWDLLEGQFPAGIVDQMWDGYGRVLETLANGDAGWQAVPRALPAALVAAPTGLPAALLGQGGLHEALLRHAAHTPQAPLLRGALSYAELADWSESVRAALQQAGVARGDRVAIVMERGPALLAAVLATLRAGAAYVPVDPKLPAERMAYLLADTGAACVLVEPGWPDADGWPDVPVLPVGRTLAAAGGTDVAAAGVDLAYVIYTSGSTGHPKGVMLDHCGPLNTVLDINRRFKVGPDDRLFGVSAFNFDLSVYDIFGTLAAGASLVYPQPAQALHPAHWLELMQTEQVTVWNSVPALMSLLVEAAEARRALLPHLRLVMLSGDKIPLELPAAIRRIAPQASIVSLGGATEASIWSIYYAIGEIDPRWLTIPYGHPLHAQPWQVRDRHGLLCPPWVAGELYIGGAGLALGYWGDPDKTAASFQRDADGARWYRTGDLGRLLGDGAIEWIGRADFQVKIQGHRIELGEIEAALMACPGLVQAVVVAAAAPGEAAQLAAHVVIEPGATFTPRELETRLMARLPAYMVPARWRAWAQLPLSPNGKVDRKVLLAAAPALRVAPGTSRIAPEGELETALLAIWEAVLGLEGIGVTDDFFDLGGQSFDAIRIFARLGERFGVRLGLGDLWQARSVRALARLAGADVPAAVALVPLRTDVAGRPLFLVHPAGGSVLGYRPLAQLLDRPVYAFQMVEDATTAAARTDITALARLYVGQLRGVQPEGPYVLGGWSTGAILAFAMAAELEAQGEPVEQVYLLDGPAPASHGAPAPATLLEWFLDDLGLDLPVERLCALDDAGLAPHQLLGQACEMVELRARAPLDAAQLLPALRCFVDLVMAGGRYQAPMVSASLTVVRVAEDRVREFFAHPHRAASDWGWHGLTRGTVHCVKVGGHHHNFLAAPIMADWGALLKVALAAPALAVDGGES